jgi:hypothetical protein
MPLPRALHCHVLLLPSAVLDCGCAVFLLASAALLCAVLCLSHLELHAAHATTCQEGVTLQQQTNAAAAAAAVFVPSCLQCFHNYQLTTGSCLAGRETTMPTAALVRGPVYRQLHIQANLPLP